MPRKAWHTLPAWPRASQKLSKGRAHADEQQAFKARCKTREQRAFCALQGCGGRLSAVRLCESRVCV